MKLSCIPSRAAARRRGFTLIEMAIVASIVGTLVASLVGVAYTARYRNTINQSVDELGIIVNNMRSYYSGRGIPAVIAATCPLTSFTSPYAVPVNSGVFPYEMVNKTNTVVNNVWNANAATSTVLIDLCNGASLTPPARQFVIRFTNLPADACTDMVLRSSMLASGANLTQIIVTAGVSTPVVISTVASLSGSSTTGNATGGVDPVTASSACSTAGMTVDWYYQLSG